jgi:hypothetical protein
MYLHPDDIKLIGEIMAEFPDAESFRLDSDNSSGIGTTLTLTVTTKINNRRAEVAFEISGVENW